MIAIVNISEEIKPFGIQTYSLRINRNEVLQFQHRREYGLAECLMQAAKEYEKKNWKDMAQVFGGDA